MAHDLGRLPAESAFAQWPTDCGELDVFATANPMMPADTGAPTERAGRSRPDEPGLEVKAVVFIDSGVSDVSAIVKAASANAELVMLDPLTDGLAQIERYLARRPGITAISLLAHDCADGVRLGSTSLTQESMLTRHKAQLANIRDTLNGRVEIACVMGASAAPCHPCVLGLLAKAVGAELVEP